MKRTFTSRFAIASEIAFALYTTACGIPKSAISKEAVPLQVSANSASLVTSTISLSSIVIFGCNTIFGQRNRTEGARTT